MTGYPARIIRSDLGGEYQDTAPVRDDTKQISADITNLAFRQMVGVNLTADLAWLIVDIDSLSVISRAEAWNPEAGTTGTYAAPVVTDEGGGLYNITYSNDYPDANGDDVPVNFRGAFAQVQEPSSGSPVVNAGRIASNVIQLRTSGFSGGEQVLVSIK